MDSKHSIHSLLLSHNSSTLLHPPPLTNPFDNPYTLPTPASSSSLTPTSFADPTPAGAPYVTAQDITVKVSAAATGKGAKKREQGGDSEGEADDGTPGGEERKKVRKRNRLALSCTECKRRKIRCDRKTPCEACCRRGEEKTCHWETPRIDAAPQPFALATEHELLKARVASLEALLRNGPQPHFQDPTGGPMYVYADPFMPAGVQRQHHQQQQQQQQPDYQQYHASPQVSEDPLDSDTEDAAIVLEELALGRKLDRVGSRARKVSAVPTPPLAGTPPNAPAHLALIQSLPPISRAMASLLVPRIEARRKLVLDDIWRSLPSSKPVLDWLVSHYFTRVDWAWHLHHKPTFLNEYEAFSQLVMQSRKDEIDPLWLAVFCMTLCLSVNSLDSAIESPLVNITEHDLATLPVKFFECAQGCLECGDWTGKPRIRTLQTIVLFAPFLLFAGTPSTGERHQTYLGAAIRIALMLGLHKLGSDPSTMPPEDPALPTGVNTMRREIPIRLFYVLLFLDFMSIKVKSSLSPAMVDCALPGNFNDLDLSAEGLVSPRPDDVATDISFEIIKFKIALQQRRFNEILVGDSGFEYDTILDLDKGYRAIIASIPTEMRMDFQAPLGEDITMVWRRNMVTQTIHNRLLRLHRPFMSRGYREVKYRHSTTSAINAARISLIAQQGLDRAPLVKSGFQLLNVQGAVVVLFFELWSEWPEDIAENEDHRLIREAVPFFERSLGSRQVPVRKIAQQSLQVVALLFDAVEKRREASEARKVAGKSWDSEEEVETYGRLLKRIGAIVVDAAGEEGRSSGLDSLGAASRLLTDGTSSTSGAASNPAIDPILAASRPRDSEWINTGNVYPMDFGRLGPIATPQASDQLEATAQDSFLALPGNEFAFDVTSLAGPEYADPGFDWLGWTALDSFATMGSF